MAQAGPASQALGQNKEVLLKSYSKRMKDDIKSMIDNYTEIIKQSKVEDEQQVQVSRIAQSEEDQYEMQVRAANIVRAAESLLKVVSDIKQFLILNDFLYVNEQIVHHRVKLRQSQVESDERLLALRDEISHDLFELEEEYYTSMHK